MLKKTLFSTFPCCVLFIVALFIQTGFFSNETLAGKVVDTNGRFFPANLETKSWLEFQAAGYNTNVWGVINNSRDALWCGMPLGGVATGCLDIDNDGTLGYSILFSRIWAHDAGVDGSVKWRDTVFTRQGRQFIDDKSRGKIGLPFAGLSAGQQVWVLTGREMGTTVNNAREIEYWGHYPIVDMEYQLNGPVQVGMRNWASFLPGNTENSNIPAAIFDIRLRNESTQKQAGNLVLSFPGPWPREIQGKTGKTHVAADKYSGMKFEAENGVGYILAVLGNNQVATGDDLGADAQLWAKISESLPALGEKPDNHGASLSVAYDLKPGDARNVQIMLAWYAPIWESDFPYDGQADRQYVNMYTERFSNVKAVADYMADKHEDMLGRIIAWQSVVYREKALPGWLRDSLVNILHLFTECGFWASSSSKPLGAWCANGGVYSLVESSVADGQQTCIPCDWYGNLPEVYFFPDLADTTLRALTHFTRDDGAVPFDLGRGLELVTHQQWDRQRTLNGCCYVDMVSRLWLRTGDDTVLERYYPTVKDSLKYMNSLVEGPASMISTAGDQWYEAMGWPGMSSHVGGVRIATLRIAKHMAEKMGDKPFAAWCQEWIDKSSELLEHYLWSDTHYAVYNDRQAQDPSQRLQTSREGAEFLADVNAGAGEKCDHVLSHQLDGEWIADLHGVPGVFRKERIDQTLATIKRINTPLTTAGLLVVVGADGKQDTKFLGRMGGLHSMPASTFISAMNFIYEGDRVGGLQIAYDCLREMVCDQGMTWDMPNVIKGTKDHKQRIYGTDYYQCMSLWGMPAALAQKDLAWPCRKGGLVDRMIKAANK